MADKADKNVDAFTGIETTGHNWDGITELNSPLPRWWLWTFYATIIFSIGYMIYYPAVPLIESATRGVSGITNRQIVAEELAAVRAAKAPIVDKIVASDFETIAADDELFRFAVAGGNSLFKVHCSQCHGSGAQGSPGYPNLNDDVWIWGGDMDAIYTTIAHGIRDEADDDTRWSEMPNFGTDELLTGEEIASVTQFVLQLSGRDHDAVQATAGAVIFEENCASCHGDAGEGSAEDGAPNLADALWHYGDSEEIIRAQIAQPRHGVMPAWGERLGEANVKQLTVYVHSLGGGE